jgi:protein-S-isoprenylcysteine O-methyltransferase Ste14
MLVGPAKNPPMRFFEPWPLNGEMWLLWVIYWTLAGFFVHRNKTMESFLHRFAHLIPMYLGFWLIFHSRHPPYFGRLYSNTAIEAFGDVLAAAGLLFTVWARVHLGRYWSSFISLKEDHQLIRTGPYCIVRHPIYTGLILAAAGSAAAASTADGLLGLFLITAACVIKARMEEAILTTQLADEYRQFKREVPFLIPGT